MKVLFVCWANVGRSQMAKAFYNSFTHTMDGDSAGTQVEFPGETLAERKKRQGDTYTIQAMAEEGIDVSDYAKTQVTEAMLPKYDKVICMAQPEYTPEWLTNAPNFLHWNIDDPGGKGLVETIIARDLVKAKVIELIR